MAANTLMHTDFVFAGQTNKYTGKVREVYTLADDTLIMIATDRLSAFDVVMPRGIPFKRSNPKSDCYANDEVNC